ncbi:MAG: hypothetical protein JST20_08995 [Bacteroidetes bacterium]|nr:hypothetical protein [Bacteroidota bacterium]
MNNNEFLNQYFDGTLGEAEQQVFFSALADDSVLRQEFNDEMLVRNTVRASVFAEAPPADLTNSIFSAVGYSGTTSVGIAPALQTSNFMKVGGYLLSFAVGCVFIVLLNHWGNSTSNTTASRSEQFQQKQQVSNSVATNQSLGSPQNSLQAEKFSHRSYRQMIHSQNKNNAENLLNNRKREDSEFLLIPNQQLPNKSNTSAPQSDVHDEETDNNNKVQISTTATKQPNISEHYSINSVTAAKQPDIYEQESITTLPQTKNFITSLRSLQSVPASGDIASNDRLGINNIALALFYKVDKHFAIGLETGREAFYQEYTHQTDSSTDFIKQNPTMWWGGAAFRGEIPELGWNETLYPYAQVGGGLAESGAYLRTSTGVCFAPLDIVSMNIGVDWTLLRYSAYTLQYSTQKVGWSYSINICF